MQEDLVGIDSASASQLMSVYSRQSSAKRRGSEALTDSGLSFINAMNLLFLNPRCSYVNMLN